VITVVAHDLGNRVLTNGVTRPQPDSTAEPTTATTLLLTRHSATPIDTGGTDGGEVQVPLGHIRYVPG
jgi:hypothetical protein